MVVIVAVVYVIDVFFLAMLTMTGRLGKHRAVLYCLQSSHPTFLDPLFIFQQILVEHEKIANSKDASQQQMVIYNT